MEQSNNAGQILGALLLGAAVGGVIGILFAPDKGSETRKNIYSKSDDLTGAIKDKFNDLIAEIRNDASKAKDKAVDFMQDGQQNTEKLKNS